MYSLLFNNDLPSQQPDSYYLASANPFPSQSTWEGDADVDVCIIGAGYTGLSAALHLAQLGYKPIVLEAHYVGWGASGRNGGQVGVGHNKDQNQLEQELGHDQAHALWDLALESVELCKSLIAQHQIECDLRTGIIQANHRKTYSAETDAYVRKLQRDYHYPHCEFLSQTQICAMIGSNNYYSGKLDTNSAHLHPLNYARGLAQAALQAGAKIYEHSPVLNYTNANKQDSVLIQTSQGQIRARCLILASNGYLDQLDSRVAKKVMPINNYMVATEPLSEALQHSLLSHHHAVYDSRFVVNYYRLSVDGRLLFGGGETYGYRYPPSLADYVRPALLRVFPQLAEAKIDYAWGGTLAITADRMPYFAELQPNIWTAAGYSGHGVALATLAGKILANAIHGHRAEFEVFNSLSHLSFPGGSLLRQPLLRSAMFYYGLRDRF